MLTKLLNWWNAPKAVDSRLTAAEYGMTQEEYDSRPKLPLRVGSNPAPTHPRPAPPPNPPPKRHSCCCKDHR